jgi:hypothetical protein
MSDAADPYLPCAAGQTDATDPGPALVAETRAAFDPAACEAEYQRINRAATSDDGSDAHEPQSDAANSINPVDLVVDALGKRLVPAPDRARLGRALDAANAPASDAGIPSRALRGGNGVYRG